MAFYNHFVHTIKSIPFIIYPEHGIEEICDISNNSELISYVETITTANFVEFENSNFNIVLVWADKGNKMADIWMYKNIDTWPGNPLVFVRNYKELNESIGEGITAGDGLILLGKEEAHRKQTISIEEYLKTRPNS